MFMLAVDVVELNDGDVVLFGEDSKGIVHLVPRSLSELTVQQLMSSVVEATASTIAVGVSLTAQRHAVFHTPPPTRKMSQLRNCLSSSRPVPCQGCPHRACKICRTSQHTLCSCTCRVVMYIPICQKEGAAICPSMTAADMWCRDRSSFRARSYWPPSSFAAIATPPSILGGNSKLCPVTCEMQHLSSYACGRADMYKHPGNLGPPVPLGYSLWGVWLVHTFLLGGSLRSNPPIKRAARGRTAQFRVARSGPPAAAAVLAANACRETFRAGLVSSSSPRVATAP
eukprot:366410-Chlamydomonas_euryale.AAC.18